MEDGGQKVAFHLGCYTILLLILLSFIPVEKVMIIIHRDVKVDFWGMLEESQKVEFLFAFYPLYLA